MRKRDDGTIKGGGEGSKQIPALYIIDSERSAHWCTFIGLNRTELNQFCFDRASTRERCQMCYAERTKFPTADLVQNSQRYYEIYNVALPICYVSMAVKTMSNYC
jgi:hypothetical protein